MTERTDSLECMNPTLTMTERTDSLECMNPTLTMTERTDSLECMNPTLNMRERTIYNGPIHWNVCHFHDLHERINRLRWSDSTEWIKVSNSMNLTFHINESDFRVYVWDREPFRMNTTMNKTFQLHIWEEQCFRMNQFSWMNWFIQLY